jgi:hypothetical protein
MKKTVKYEMYVNTRNLIGPTVQITKKQYDAFLKGYTKAIADNHEKEKPEYYNEVSDRIEENDDYARDIEVEVKECEKYTQTSHVLYDFGYEGGCMVLKKLETKEGFYWK